MENTPGALIAMSGGVDSSVAAYLMKQAGYRCMGATMRLYQNEDLGQCGFHTCCSAKDVEDAADVAFQLDIPFEVINYTDEFRKKVIKKFIATYETGGTPNPCIDCNRYMKFDKMLAFAREHGLDYVVTGHYARIEQDPDTGRWLLKKALYGEKDQSYVLYVLTQDELAHTRFPLGGMDKPSIRALAEKAGFCNAHKHDSQDICFVPDGDYVGFMERYTGKFYPDGDFIDTTGKVVGRHHGAVRYTNGQRKGLGLALGAPVYVCDKDMEKNTVTVGPESELFTTTLVAGDFNWISIPEYTDDIGEQVNIIAKYEGYIASQLDQVNQFKKFEKKLLPENIDYSDVKGLRVEAIQKLSAIRPVSIGQASRISGVSPADISVLLIYLEHQYKKNKQED